MKTYNIEGNIINWLDNHREIIHDDILEACELGLGKTETIEIAKIKNPYGVTVLKIDDPEEIFESLEKAERYYVEVELYEKAGRALKCRNLWFEHLTKEPNRYIEKELL